MRFTALLAIAVCCLLPLARAAPNPIPVVTVVLGQPMQLINYSDNATDVAFTGSVKVDKLPVERMWVVLAASVDRGWSANCNPSTIVITDTNAHDFTCTVTVPGKTPDSSGNLTVEASGAAGFTQTARCNGSIAIIGRPPPPVNGTNQTKTNTTGGGSNGNQTGTGGSSGAATNDIVSQLARNAVLVSATALVVIVVVAIAAFLRYRRKGAVEVVEVVEDEP